MAITKIRQTIFLMVMLLTPMAVWAQNGSFMGKTKDFKYRKNIGKEFSFEEELEKRPEESRDTLYLLQNWWLPGKVVLENGDTVQEEKIRYDLAWNQLEILKEQEVMKDTLTLDSTYQIIDLRTLNQFVLKDSLDGEEFVYHYVNGHNYSIEGVPLVGVFEVLVDGPCQLISRIMLKKVRAYIDYMDNSLQADLDNDSRNILNDEDDYKIRTEERKEELYWASESGNLTKVDSRRKKALQYFGVYGKQIDKFMKEHNYTFRSDDDLKEITTFYNSLLKQAEEQ
ncbi:hypothetical protein V6R21_06960 [Limibacter armeniacum]|uniref:hypothetical protein n=1 Tax=Limibacter armeniacum TaxID=466084 RepID=UPI002FE5F920